MFNTIKVGETAVVNGKEYRVVRVSPSRFWLEIDGTAVKFAKKSGVEYGVGRERYARPVDEAPAPERRRQGRKVAIGDLPDPEFNWLMEVDTLLGPDVSVMEAIRAGWDWRAIYDQFPNVPLVGAREVMEAALV
jgi:hypothetical protein